MSIAPQIVFCVKAFSFSEIYPLFVSSNKFLCSCWIWSRISSSSDCLISVCFCISGRSFCTSSWSWYILFLLLKLFLSILFCCSCWNLRKLSMAALNSFMFVWVFFKIKPKYKLIEVKKWNNKKRRNYFNFLLTQGITSDFFFLFW